MIQPSAIESQAITDTEKCIAMLKFIFASAAFAVRQHFSQNLHFSYSAIHYIFQEKNLISQKPVPILILTDKTGKNRNIINIDKQEFSKKIKKWLKPHV